MVGDLLVEPGLGRVTRGGKEIPLPKLSFELLLALTRAAPNLLSLDALMGKVWPGLVVSPETVSQRVKLLRDALGDDPKAPRYIGGLRGRGYRLIAPIVSPGAHPGTQVGPRERVASPDDRRDAAEVLPFSPPPRSVAVLAFENLSGNPGEDYFSDGLSEELVHVLARIAELRVAARTSSFSFKGVAVDIPTVGRRLNVGAVLEGSVRRSGDRVRITAQLINARDGYHFWSESYDRAAHDVLDLQSEIAAKVADSLKVTLVDDVRRRLATGATADSRAFDAYLRARHAESIQDEQALRAALVALDKAISLDPEFANAFAVRADVLAKLANLWVEDVDEKARLNADALGSAEKAVSMAPASALAHSMLGSVLSMSTPLSAIATNYARIDAAYRRSIELEPGNAEFLSDYGTYAARLGRADALEAAERARALDPVNWEAHANLGVTLFCARRYDDARVAFAEAVRLSTNRLATFWAGWNELAAGRPREALEYVERDLDFWYHQPCLAMA
jgi:adenylate cyclase